MSETPAHFLFYDLETFGQDPRRSRIAQFAAVRTDAQLQVVGEAHNVLIQPADDLLPMPQATLITGLTPQRVQAQGINEAAAFAQIYAWMMQPNTCILGYNSLRFDDEFIRHGLFRNFYDPYAREWRNGNSRHDVLDMLRLMHALRPEGIAWPQREDGFTSFKLEHLAQANQIHHESAHEALSDVYVTLGLARRLRQAQPRLWDYALKLRDKQFVGSLLDVRAMEPVLHVSMRYPASRHCAALVLPLAYHPQIKNRVIVFDLSADIQPLLELPAEILAQRLYTPHSELTEDQSPIALKEVHLNRAPALVAFKHLRAPDFQRLGIDPAHLLSQAARLRQAAPVILEKIRSIFTNTHSVIPVDVDGSLYEGFISGSDKYRLQQVITTQPEALATLQNSFKNRRLPELLFRYRARNYRHTLSDTETKRWNAYRRQRLLEPSALSEYTLPDYFTEITRLRAEYVDNERAQSLLDELEHWGQSLQASLNRS